MTLAITDPGDHATFVLTVEDLRTPGRLRTIKMDADDWLRHFADHPEQRPFLLGAIHRTWHAGGYLLVRMAVISGVHHYQINLANYKLELMYVSQTGTHYPSEDHRDEQLERQDKRS
ncbi:hypothetical protein [Cupriavidus metallidurans]|uniref:hypothetical protein n=1 Tax=Cupriavidus metallidurans TaxID=119219 RepID=UPI001CD0024B|nr:hypothetical protein [Cupriavidus metallidurans]UBM12789.1 hypothetical protein LAI70_27945 [Cupriavidus metallidurans]